MKLYLLDTDIDANAPADRRITDRLYGGDNEHRLQQEIVLGIGGIAAGVAVALLADRLAHRRRAAALSAGFERAITLPLGYHARTGSGRVVRTMLAGTDSLFMLWLSFFREHLSALVGIAFLVPTALVMSPQLAGLLAALAVQFLFDGIAASGLLRGGGSSQ